MQRALDETSRRRKKQLAYNAEHGITPQGIKKAVADVMHAGYERGDGKSKLLKAAEGQGSYDADPNKLAKQIKAVEKDMYEAAANLEFEKAAAKRDELQKLRDLLTGVEAA